ncbi:hypothetical protein KY345_04770, partial [Candidatus Woesearchaeota archaeon]|nr:hypothetical protein [Candidatus Woesearchaeota archaeon]
LEEIFHKTSLMDVILVVIASLAIVSFWRGVWGLMDLYIFPENYLLSYVSSTVIGLAILVAGAFYRSKRYK